VKSLSNTILSGAALLALTLFAACSTAPKAEDRADFMAESRTAQAWFERNVPGLRSQIKSSAGYIVFPSVGQWGIIFGGGQFGRGTLNRPNGTQVGWAALNTGSFGLQAGVRGFKMLVVIEDEATMRKFRDNQLSGSISAVAVVSETGESGTMRFQEGVAIYQGASTGLIAGVNVALDYLRYQPLD